MRTLWAILCASAITATTLYLFTHIDSIVAWAMPIADTWQIPPPILIFGSVAMIILTEMLVAHVIARKSPD